MNRQLRIITASVLACLTGTVAADRAPGQSEPARNGSRWSVVVVPVHGNVDKALYNRLARSLQTERNSDNVLYVLEMDSFGGRVDAAYDIVDTILNVRHARTAAFVRAKAISAAAMIALACEDVFMKEHATLGDCAPIVTTFEGPRELGEKYQSPLRARFRSLAKRNGYPEKLAEAMVTKSMRVFRVETPDSTAFVDSSGLRRLEETYEEDTLSRRIVVNTGELLTMDAVEAADLMFSRKTVGSVEEILSELRVRDYSLHRVSPGKGMFGWGVMSNLERLYWYLAVPASLLFLIMAGLTFMGLGDSGGADADIDVAADVDSDIDVDAGAEDVGGAGESFFDALHLFTVRNFIVFFMIFGWTGIAMIRSNAGTGLTIAVSFVAGLIMMFVVSLMFYLVSRLVHSGNVSIRSSVGHSGTVYLAIPDKRKGTGKVNVVVGGRKQEYKAMTDGKRIATGESIAVVGLVNNEIVLVRKS